MRKGIIAASSAVWHPAGFIAQPSDGSWWNATTVANKWQDSAGTIPVTGTGQYVKRWRDMLGSRDLVVSHPSLGILKWDSSIKGLRHSSAADSGGSLNYYPPSPIPISQPVTVMARIYSNANTGNFRLGMQNQSFGDYYAAWINVWSSYASPAVRHGIVNPPAGLFSGSSPLGFNTCSFVKLPSGQLSDLYWNGVAIPKTYVFGQPYGGPTTEALIHDLTAITIFINAFDVQDYRLRDFIVAFKEATPADHIGYHSYVQNL